MLKLSTCVALSVKTLCRTSDLNITGLHPPAATKHIRYVLLINSRNNWNLLLWLLMYLCNKYSL